MKRRNTQILQLVLSIAIVGSMITLAYFLVIREPQETMTKIDDVDITSNIASTDPRQSTANFITANGTMGSVEDITQDNMKTGEAVFENAGRRLFALTKAKDGLIPGSPLISGNEESHIRMFTRDLNSPYIYSIDNIEVSNPSEPTLLTVFSDVGPSDYPSVDVLVSFDSKRTHYTRAGDSSYDGTHTQISNVERFEDVKVTLVQSGDLWFVYDIEDSEYLINERFATWSGISNSTIDFSKNETTGEFIIEADRDEYLEREGQNE